MDNYDVIKEEMIPSTSETIWFERMVPLIDSGLECSLNAVVDDEGELMYVIENDGELVDFRDYNEALKNYIMKAHKKAMM